MVDIIVTTRSKVAEEQLFKDREPRKTKNVVDWDKEEPLKQLMVETIQHIYKPQTQTEEPPHPWRDGIQPSQVCQILLLWAHRNFGK